MIQKLFLKLQEIGPKKLSNHYSSSHEAYLCTSLADGMLPYLLGPFFDRLSVPLVKNNSTSQPQLLSVNNHL